MRDRPLVLTVIKNPGILDMVFGKNLSLKTKQIHRVADMFPEPLRHLRDRAIEIRINIAVDTDHQPPTNRLALLLL
jgi:hypothetical protein